MIEVYVPLDHQNDNFYELLMEKRARDLKNPSTTDEHASFQFQIEPLQSTSYEDQRKQLDAHINDSGVNSPLASFRSQALSFATPIGTSTPHPSISLPTQVAQPSPTGLFSPFQNFIRKSAKLSSKEPKYNHSQPNHPDHQSVLRTYTREGYKF